MLFLIADWKYVPIWKFFAGKEIAGDDKNNVQKQEETVPEIIASDKCMDIDSAKTEVKQESTISTPQISKAPRKRITPMAIDWFW